MKIENKEQLVDCNSVIPFSTEFTNELENILFRLERGETKFIFAKVTFCYPNANKNAKKKFQTKLKLGSTDAKSGLNFEQFCRVKFVC